MWTGEQAQERRSRGTSSRTGGTRQVESVRPPGSHPGERKHNTQMLLSEVMALRSRRKSRPGQRPASWGPREAGFVGLCPGL